MTAPCEHRWESGGICALCRVSASEEIAALRARVERMKAIQASAVRYTLAHDAMELVLDDDSLTDAFDVYLRAYHDSRDALFLAARALLPPTPAAP